MNRRFLSYVPLAGALLVVAVPALDHVRNIERAGISSEDTDSSPVLNPVESHHDHHYEPLDYSSLSGHITEVTTRTGQTRIHLTNTPGETADTLSNLMGSSGGSGGPPGAHAGLRTLTASRSEALWELILHLDEDAIVHGAGNRIRPSPETNTDSRERTALERVFAAPVPAPTQATRVIRTDLSRSASNLARPATAPVSTTATAEASRTNGFIRLTSGRRMVWVWSGETLHLEEHP